MRLTTADNGAAFCLERGDRVEVYLMGSVDRPWSIEEDGAALRAAANGMGSLPAGVQGAFFVADRAGTAHVRASRGACGRPPPSGAACGAVQAYGVTVVVR